MHTIAREFGARLESVRVQMDGVYTSVNGGVNWTEIDADLTTEISILSVA